MPIIDKSGKVFKLRGPNPLMNDQNVNWDKSKLILYNFSWNSECVQDPTSSESKFKKENPKIDIAEELDLKSNSEWIPPFEFINELKDSKPEIKEEVTKEINVNSQVARIFHERGMEFHCSPIYSVPMKDDLYGTEYMMNRYGDKFIFDGVIIEENDLELVYWCVKNMTVGSIVMPKARESRWWRVDQVEEKTGGFLVKAFPSDVNPDFS